MQTQSLKNLTDEQLVIDFQNTGDNQIFGEIYNRYYKKVYHTCLGYAKDRDTAFDLVQDIMMKVMEKLPKLSNANLLGFWIYRISNNYCVDYYHSKKRLSVTTIEDRFDIASEETDMEALAEKERLLDSMEDLMGTLDAETQTILHAKYLQGASIKDLQSRLNISASAVKMRLKRGRDKIHQLYQSQSRVALG